MGTWQRTKHLEDGEAIDIQYVKRSNLTFKEDSTYSWNSFHLIEHGKWAMNVARDTLILHDAKVNRNDLCCFTYMMTMHFIDSDTLVLEKWYKDQLAKHVSQMYFTRVKKD